MAETPTAPPDAYQGAEDEAEKQKRALVQILGQQGQYGAQQLQNRASAAQMLNAQPTEAGLPRSATTQAMYDAFTRDAQSAIDSHGMEQQRIQAANQAYMDQVRGAVPLQRADLQSYTDAQRMAFEDREKERQAREAERAAAAARASAASASANRSYESIAREKRDVEKKFAAEDWDSMPPEMRTALGAAQVGKSGSALSVEDAMKALGMSVPTGNVAPGDNYWKTEGRTYTDAKKANSMMQSFFSDMMSSDATWGEVVSTARSLTPDNFAEYGLDMTQFDPKAIGVWLAAYAPLWGNNVGRY